MRFDIDDFRQRTDRLRWDDLDLRRFAVDPLDDESLRAIEYMHDVEHHTICYLRDLLVTPAHADPAMMTFLSCWAYEELWHGEALGDVLAAHGRPAGAVRVGHLRQRLGLRDRLRPFLSAASSTLVGERVLALHMTWGAVNEWTTQGGYARLAQRAKHPLLSALVRRITRQEGRHIDFYATEAGRRLAQSQAARKLVRWGLTHLWRPVGSGVMPAAETAFVIRHLFGGPEGAQFVERIDRRIEALPGLEGLRLIAGELGRHNARAAVVAPGALAA